MNTTTEDMLERFKLYGEIYCILADIPDYDYMDDIRIEANELCEVLEIEEDDLVFEFGEEEGMLESIEVEDDMINIWYIGWETGYRRGWTIIQFPTETISKIKNIIERYIKALKEDEES